MRAVGSLLFVSGFCALTYQVVWLRELRLVFGSSTAASAAVLAIFMGGLGAGARWLGPAADRSPNPLRRFARLELAIALAAALSPLLLGVVRSLYISAGGGTLARLGLAALVLLPATLCMGATLPAAARAVQHEADRSRGGTARLYGLNTLGGVAGLMLTTFVTIEAFGVRRSLLLACVLNLAVAGVALALARVRTVEPDAPRSASGPTSGFVLAAAALTGFTFLSVELVWYRMLAPLLGGTTYTLGLVLALVLAGIGGGATLYAAVARRLSPSLALLASTCGAEGLALMLPVALGDRLALLALAIQPEDGAFGPRVAGWTLVAGCVVLLPSLVAGFRFPLLIALAGSGRASIGDHVGRVYAANALGGVAGALAGGWWLLPTLGAVTLWRLDAALIAALGIVAIVFGRKRVTGPALVAATLVLIFLAPGPTAAWRHSPIGAGRARDAPASKNERRAWLHDRRRAVIWEREGRESSIAVDASDGLSLLVGGKSDGNLPHEAPTLELHGLLGALLHPEPRSALVIGLGSGSSAMALARVPTITIVDVVELEPAVVEYAERWCGFPRDRRSVDLSIGDAREYLQTSRRRFDLIASQPSNPYRAGVASLFTREMYAAARERLAGGGLFLQWMQAYEVDAETVRSIIVTLQAVFPHVEIWQTSVSDMLFVCSVDARPLDLDALRRRITESPYSDTLTRIWRTDSIDGLLARRVAPAELATAIAANAETPVNTDDRPLVEFRLARSVGRAEPFRIESLRALAIERGFLPEDSLEIAAERVALYTLEGVAPPDDAYGPVASWHQAYVEQREDDALAGRRADTRNGVSLLDRLITTDLLAGTGVEAASASIETWREQSEPEADALLSRLRVRQRRFAEAGAVLSRLFEGYRRDAGSWPPLMRRALQSARETARAEPATAPELYAALRQPFALRLLDEPRRETAVFIGGLAGPDEAAESVEAFEPHVRWEEEFLRLRVERYEAVDHPLTERARRDLARFERQSGL